MASITKRLLKFTSHRLHISLITIIKLCVFNPVFADGSDVVGCVPHNGTPSRTYTYLLINLRIIGNRLPTSYIVSSIRPCGRESSASKSRRTCNSLQDSIRTGCYENNRTARLVCVSLLVYRPRISVSVH